MKNKIIKNIGALPYILHSIYFNFKYLPFKQAIHLPILLFKPHFHTLKGSVAILGGVKFGMVKLGIHGVSIYPSSGVMIQNCGKIIFTGQCHIGSGSSLAVGEGAVLKFGEKFSSTAELKIVCSKQISFGNNVLVGWECLFMDTNFHTIINVNNKSPYGKVSSPIEIDDNCWFAFRNTVMPGSVVPCGCVIASNSLVNKDFSSSPYSLLAGLPAKIKKEGVTKDPNSK